MGTTYQILSVVLPLPSATYPEPSAAPFCTIHSRGIMASLGAIGARVFRKLGGISNGSSYKMEAVKVGNWCPGSVRPAYLDQTLPGDFGFDPLGLGAVPGAQGLERFRECEIFHGRWCMLAIVGMAAREGQCNHPQKKWTAVSMPFPSLGGAGSLRVY